MTDQERYVGEVLGSFGMEFVRGYAVGCGKKTFVVDFFVPKFKVVLECTCSDGVPSHAVGVLAQKCAYLNYKFRKIKAGDPALVCGVLAEAPKAHPSRIRGEIYDILDEADFIITSLEELHCFLRGWSLGLEASRRVGDTQPQKGPQSDCGAEAGQG